ncbi:MAG: serine/threonine protein phosphatase [Verrucomicrobia bacterium]|nr:serine/threonine protein phosphatase [Verrucomicrobiota bacterium]
MAIFLLLFTCISSFIFCDSFSKIKAEIDKLPYLQKSIIAQNVERYAEEPELMYDAVNGAKLADLDFDTFYKTERELFETFQASPRQYLDGTSPPDGYFDPSQVMAREHYVQKLEVPVGARVLLHGDLHGDVHSLVESLEPYMRGDDGFRLIEDVYFVALGDYVDKGLYGLECIYVLMRLKIDNPERVFFVRGNHEDRGICYYYGFQAELTKKGFTPEQIDVVYRLYDVLPDAIYLGSNHNFVQLCHGGLELGYLPTALLNSDKNYEWVTELNRLTVYSQLSIEAQESLHPILEAYPFSIKDKIKPIPNATYEKVTNNPPQFLFLGFMWNDFIVDENEPPFYKNSRGFSLNRKITTELLDLASSEQNKLCGILRAHQHRPDVDDPMMKLLLENRGIAKLWSDGPLVATFLLSPDTLLGVPDGPWPGFDFDTLGELQTAEEFSGWTLQNTQKEKVSGYERSAAPAR